MMDEDALKSLVTLLRRVATKKSSINTLGLRGDSLPEAALKTLIEDGADFVSALERSLKLRAERG